MTSLRWIATAVSPIVVWAVVGISGIWVQGRIVQLLCPADEFISGVCLDPRVGRVELFLVYTFIALSAIAVVLTTFVCAPKHRLVAGYVSFCIGAIAATFLAIILRGGFALVVALAAGLLTVLLLHHFSSDPDS